MSEQNETPSYPVVPAGKEHDPSYYIPPYDATVTLEPNFFCRARNTKREKYCRARAGQGTDHLGQGRCRNHGGSTPIQHGRYSEVVRGALGEHLDRLELESEKEKLDILPEAMMIRGITMEVAEKWDRFFKAIVAWNEEEAEEAKENKERPRFLQVPQLTDLAELAKKSAEVVNMVHKQRSMNAISAKDFSRLMAAMAECVVSQCEKFFIRTAGQPVIDEFLKSLEAEWRKLKVSSK